MKQYTLEGRRPLPRNAPSGSTDSFGGASLKLVRKIKVGADQAVFLHSLCRVSG